MAETRREKAIHEATTVELRAEPPATSDVRLDFAAQTHVGKVRATNQDQYLIARLRKSVDVLASPAPPGPSSPLLQREGYLFLVADGMGGAVGGAVASALVVREALRHVLETAKWFFRLDDPDEELRLRLLREALERADRTIVEEGERDPGLAGMGTTLTAMSILGSEGFVVHVGDSRAYRFRNGSLEQLTRDHTITGDLLRRGLIKPEEARSHRRRHVLTNVMGCKQGVEGEVAKVWLADGDRVLLCTDGLHGPLTDADMAAILAAHPGPNAACRALIDAALNKGGPDNVTVVVADFAIQEPGR